MRKRAGEVAGEVPKEMAPVVFLRRTSSTVVAAPEVADLILARSSAGESLSQIAAGLHMTPGEVRAVLRPLRMVPDVRRPARWPEWARLAVADFFGGDYPAHRAGAELDGSA